MLNAFINCKIDISDFCLSVKAKLEICLTKRLNGLCSLN